MRSRRKENCSFFITTITEIHLHIVQPTGASLHTSTLSAALKAPRQRCGFPQPECSQLASSTCTLNCGFTLCSRPLVSLHQMYSREIRQERGGGEEEATHSVEQDNNQRSGKLCNRKQKRACVTRWADKPDRKLKRR